ncbi:hypothetical protein Sango_1185700 [Sesamum angolense]|uniref:Reverse transcriptase domain-containing protein n=1 Tax=Sesamum angolense TaxID=2727404 RepID=A0AAE1WWP7_9LAMI|nr:hypothetical protein Sango_1185700 [Sesamum angolense]
MLPNSTNSLCPLSHTTHTDSTHTNEPAATHDENFDGKNEVPEAEASGGDPELRHESPCGIGEDFNFDEFYDLASRVLNGDSTSMANLNSLKDRWEQKFKARRNPALKSVTGRPSTPFRPRVSLLPRRSVRTGLDAVSLTDLENQETNGCSSSPQEGPISFLPQAQVAQEVPVTQDLDAPTHSLTVQAGQLAQPDIYIGKVKLQSYYVDNIAGAFLQSSRKTLQFIPPTRQNGEIVIRPTKEVVDNGSKKWYSTTVGYFLGKRPYFPQLENFARTNWKGLQHVLASSSGFFFFRFHSRLAMEDVIEGGPWLFQGLSTVASGVRTPLYADGITKACSRLDFARVCVMLSFDSELPKHLVVISPVLRNGKEDPKRIDVEYEWLPQRCKNCCSLGHVAATCPAIIKRIQHRLYQYSSKNRVLNRTLFGLNRALDRKRPLSQLPPDDGRFMIKAASWIVRGLNGLDHQRAVEQLVRDHKLSFIGLIETRVSQANVQRTRRNLLNNWSWFEDYAGPAGRIWLAWNSLEVGVEILEVGSSLFTVGLSISGCHTRCLISVLYGDYDIIPRRELWSTLRNLSTGILAEPWLVLGDFNAVVDESEVCGQAADTRASMVEFSNCIRETGLVQLPFTGCPYTWHNCSEGFRSLWKRLNRMLANEVWLDIWPNSSYLTALPSTSDHSPLILTGMISNTEHAIFKFDNYLAHLLGFLGSVDNIWKHRISGTAMYESMCKLKLLKAEFRRQKKRTGNLTENVQKAKTFLDKAQYLFTTYKEDIFLNLVKCCRRVYSAAVRMEISMLQQRAKLRWLQHGDQSPDGFTSAFYRAAWPIIGQSMFEAIGRSISDNILLAQELLAAYNQTRLPERCTLKVDIQKAYDSVEWDFLLEVLKLFNFPLQFITLIEQCISTASFSVSLNGSIHGFFKGGRGLRQGDPMSPYLFVLVMEIWSSLLRHRVHNAAHFQYHWKCKELGLLNLCFADDVLIFCYTIRAVQHQRQQILEHLGFQEGSLPIKYLGVLRNLEQKMRTFLWQGHTGRGNAKVAWDQLCKPKAEGGLGISNLITTNQALILKQLWRILQNDGTSIWVDWIQQYRLRHSTVWTFNRTTGSWSWKKMLKLRHLLQRGVIYKVGDGSSFSLWQDIWHERGPLCLTYPRGPAVTGLPLSSTLSSVLQGNQWCWPASTDADIAEIMSQLPPTQHSAPDNICWISDSGKYTLQSAKLLMQPPNPRVHWHGLLRGTFKIPRHGFILWLAFLEKLSTMDKPWVPNADNGKRLSFSGHTWNGSRALHGQAKSGEVFT